MQKIYGYKTEDVISLARFISQNDQGTLTDAFRAFGAQHQKAQGTVRNLYYALVKYSKGDAEFCKEYLGGKPLTVNKIVEFSDDEEKQLVKSVLLEKGKGRSVRGAILELSGGDAKTALRYQNKFRNAMKNKPELIKKVVEELKEGGHKVCDYDLKVWRANSLPQLERLKEEINGLVSKISIKTRRENEILKNKVLALEKENVKLMNLLYASDKKDVERYFKARQNQNAIN